jgi:hypothetical protein
MDYTATSLLALFKGPICNTPQGRVLIIQSLLYLVGAVFAFVFADAAPLWLKPTSFAGLCLFMPLLLFLIYVKDNQPEFEASLTKAVWGVIWGVLPIGLWLWRTYI